MTITDTKIVLAGKALNFVSNSEDPLTAFLNFFLAEDLMISNLHAKGNDTTGRLVIDRTSCSTRLVQTLTN